ncbi:hypothetical protein BJV77DRAFT_1068135 [Russula vinacea]|nr:hypothetical protein BJV77DRAFT_1068135 [Russula vinacea]
MKSFLTFLVHAHPAAHPAPLKPHASAHLTAPVPSPVYEDHEPGVTERVGELGLHHQPKHTATGAPDQVLELVLQRCCWLNGSFFAAEEDKAGTLRMGENAKLKGFNMGAAGMVHKILHNAASPTCAARNLEVFLAEPDAKAYEWEAEGLRNTMAIPCEKLGELFLPSELETAAHAMRREKRRPKSGRLQAAYMALQCRMAGWPCFPLADGVEVRLASEIQHENEATSGNNKLSPKQEQEQPKQYGLKA